MPENIYEIISLAARYWFALLGVVIVWRAFRWLRKDRKANHRRLRQLPDAGMIGEMVVLEGSDELIEGTAIPVPREGVMGFVRGCDVVVPVNGVAAKHLDFSFQDGKGLLLFPLRGAVCYVDDVELTHRSNTKKHPMCHGSRLQVGEAVLRLRLFAGLDAEYRAHVPYERQYQPFYDEPDVTQDWQDTNYVYRQEPSPWQENQNPWEQPELFDEDDWREQPQEASWLNPPPYQTWQEQPPQPFQQPQAYQPRRRRRYHEE